MSGDNSLYNWLFYSSPFQPFTTVLITDLNLEGETKQLSDLDLVSENLLGARPATETGPSIWYGYSAPNEGDIR